MKLGSVGLAATQDEEFEDFSARVDEVGGLRTRSGPSPACPRLLSLPMPSRAVHPVRPRQSALEVVLL